MEITAKGLEPLAGMPDLRRLSLWQSARIDDNAAAPLLNLKQLEILDLGDTAVSDAILDRLERDYAADFASGLLAESPAKLRRLHAYFAAVNQQAPFSPPRCNAPHISTVIEVHGSVRPCFFLPTVGKIDQGTLGAAIRRARVEFSRARTRSSAHTRARPVSPRNSG